MDKRNLVVTLQCFVQKDGKYLMLHRAPDKKIMPDVWMAPGGHIEFGEGLFEAARREVLEETGLEITNLKVKAIGTGILEDLNLEVFFKILTADYKSGNLVTSLYDGTFEWLTKKEILEKPTLLAELKHVLPHVVSNSNYAISYKAIYSKENTMTSFLLEK